MSRPGKAKIGRQGHGPRHLLREVHTQRTHERIPRAKEKDQRGQERESNGFNRRQPRVNYCKSSHFKRRLMILLLTLQVMSKGEAMREIRLESTNTREEIRVTKHKMKREKALACAEYLTPIFELCRSNCKVLDTRRLFICPTRQHHGYSLDHVPLPTQRSSPGLARHGLTRLAPPGSTADHVPTSTARLTRPGRPRLYPVHSLAAPQLHRTG